MKHTIKIVLKYVMMIFAMLLIISVIFAFRLFSYGYL